MKIICIHEHLNCTNYRMAERAPVEILQACKGECIERDIIDTEIVFLIEGRINFSCGCIENGKIENGKIMLIPAGDRIIADVEKDARILICRFRDAARLCDNYPLEKLYAEVQIPNTEFSPLNFNDRIDSYLNSFIPCIEDGLRCHYYFEAKFSELLFILRAYYPKEDLAGFFGLLLSPDIEFSDFVRKNYRKAHNVSEFAAMANVGIPTFKSKFKRVFGIAAKHWLDEHKMRNIYHELICSNKSIKEISCEYHFASVSHLNAFCLRKLSATPGQIRKQKKGIARS